MTENPGKNTSKKSITPDWLVRGVLTKFGDIFDRLTGRKWQPSSSLATSELVEKLKNLLDADVEDSGEKGKFVPHNIKLKMQWDKFSADSDTSLKKLETELLSAAVDHINDHHYHTFAPLKIEVKTDYFTEGVKLSASFDKTTEDEEREVAVNVTVPNLKNEISVAAPPSSDEEIFAARFSLGGIEKNVRLKFHVNQRLSVGRTKENALAVEDSSISKIHASLFVNPEKQLTVADTGSTNGTFINNERIAYGKAYPLTNEDRVKFGTVEVTFEHLPKPAEPPKLIETENKDLYKVGEFEFINSSQKMPIEENSEVTAVKNSKNGSKNDSETGELAQADNQTEQNIFFNFPKEETNKMEN